MSTIGSIGGGGEESNAEERPQALPSDVEVEFGGREVRLRLEKKLLRKLDMRMSMLVLIYILNYIDRTNVSAARLEGFEADLHLKGQQFNTVLGIFYVGYVLIQVPSNMFLNHIGRPSIYLPACMVLWGTLSCLTGATHNFTGALLARFFLGIVEAAVFPGALFLLSKWYKRSELGLRTALLSCGFLISNAFGSLIASGILSGMQGKLGHAAWRWLFFIEGALTISVAIIATFILPDFPENSQHFLSPEEIRLAVLRMQEDVGIGDEEMERRDSRFHGLRDALGDWRVYWLALALLSLVVSLSFSVFFPTLVETLGYSPTVTLLLCAPPWGFAAVVAFAVSRHSDKTGERFFHIVIPLFIGIIGFVTATLTMRLAARYLALFLMAQSLTGYICFLTWTSNTFAHSPSKRAVALAFVNAFSQLGNIASSYVWQKSWGPTYIHSYAICISTSGLGIIMCLIFRQVLANQNKRLEQRESSAATPRGYRFLL
ncbi:MFS general substrate transporter [Lactifluus volemus]|nr:MFS general substrate transporter [Lactifluus volemus]